MMALVVSGSVALMVARGDSVAGLSTVMVAGVGGVYWPLIQLEMCGTSAILMTATYGREGVSSESSTKVSCINKQSIFLS